MNQTFSHQFTSADCRTYVEHTFTVQENTRQLDFTFARYSPLFSEGKPYDNQVNVTIFDASGAFRGWRSAREGRRFSIGENAATDGCMPGALPPGEWVIVINIYRVFPPSTVEFTIELEQRGDETLLPQPQHQPARTSNKGAGWYIGDLHTHTYHSDGHWTVEQLNAFARYTGLDFLHLSDHNTISGNAHHRALSDENFVGLGGIELTTSRGHVVVVGSPHWLDWGVRNTRPAFREIAQKLKEDGYFMTIAHPKNIGEPYCGGCRWIFEDDVSDLVSGIEIWNGVWSNPPEGNQESLDLFYQWLNDGKRIVATAGTDAHGFPELYTNKEGYADVHWFEDKTSTCMKDMPAGKYPEGLGLNVIWAEEFTEAGILAGLKAGRSYVTDGPRLHFTGNTIDGESVMLGGCLPTGQPVTLRLEWKQCDPDGFVRLILNGKETDRMHIAETGSKTWQIMADTPSWCTVEVRNPAGHLRAVTNPIYFE